MQARVLPNRRNRIHKLELVGVQAHGNTRWKLKGYYVNGKRQRKFFASKAEGTPTVEQRYHSA